MLAQGENSNQSNQRPSSVSPTGKDSTFEAKPHKKIIRVLTVMAYVLSVSMAAILLSIYYVFIWEGHPHLGAHQAPTYEHMRINNSSMAYHHTDSDNNNDLDYHIGKPYTVPSEPVNNF